MDLQDALKSCGWSVQTAMEKIRSDAKVINISSQKFGSFQPKRERLRDHEVTGIFSHLQHLHCTANPFLLVMFLRIDILRPYRTQCHTTDLNKRSLPRPKTTTA